ncbi:hypothetical protein F5Y08DRAFT_340072 [Xylaria arbuscula]|nr:hypothetical protein F5Y08DRAFT_340072 [Xylaria arbuscula]
MSSFLLTSVTDRSRVSKKYKVKPIEYEARTTGCEEGDDELREESMVGPHSYTRYELEERASFLDKYLEDLCTKATSKEMAAKPMLPQEVLVDIQKWIKIPSSNVMWVEGPAYTHEDQLSCTAAHIYELASRAKVPCIFFSPKTKNQRQIESPSLTTARKRQATLIALLYSLIGQLIRVLAPEFESPANLEEMLNSLSEKFTSADVALDLIEALLEHAPPVLLVMLDKLQLADSQETRPYLSRLVTLLRGKNRTQVTKTMFTTGGGCLALAESTNRRERVDAGRMGQGRPGQPLRGWSSVDDLRFK